jgi:hypothetical protein
VVDLVSVGQRGIHVLRVFVRAEISAVIGTTQSVSASGSTPLQPTNALRTQFLVLESEWGDAGIPSGAQLRAVALFVGNPAGSGYSQLDVQLAATLTSSLDIDFVDANFSTVFTGSLAQPVAEDWLTLEFAAPWVYSGGHVAIQFCNAELSGGASISCCAV